MRQFKLFAAVLAGTFIGALAAQAQQAPTAPAAAAAPQRIETLIYNGWTVSCSDNGNPTAKRTCSASFKVTDSKNNQVVMVWQIGFDKAGKLSTALRTPTGVLIAPGVALQFGQNKARTLNYVACMPQQCEAALAMDDAFIKEASAAAEATATLSMVDGKSVQIKMQLVGMDKALAALRKG